jgi:uncharacterized protein YaaN involved in tellurite resistance
MNHLATTREQEFAVHSRPERSITPGNEQSEIERLMREIDVRDLHTILFFGAQAQEELTRLSDQMLGNLRNKDTGQAGEALNAMVATLRGFDGRDLERETSPSWVGRLLGKGRDIARALQRYETVTDQIETISARMEQHQTELLIDIESLERLYAAGLDYLRVMETYIAAGNRRLQQLNDEELPRLEHHTSTDRDTLAAQQLRDMRTARDQLERRIHDLQLSRQVLLQNLPSIRLIQENDRALVSKIRSTLVNTLPLWRQQLAQALTIEHSREAANSLQAANDLTNDLLRSNADALREGNRAVREQVERGVFDIEAIDYANQTLIATINDSLAIAEQGRQARLQANERLQAMEQQLRQSLQAASAQEQSLDDRSVGQ